jgi:hypothetical protein
LIDFVNEQDKLNDTDNLGKYVTTTLNRQGNLEYAVEGETTNYTQIPKTSYKTYNDLVVVSRDLNLNKNLIKYTLQLSKDFINRSSYVGRKSAYRPFEIPNTDVVHRQDKYTEFIVLTKTIDDVYIASEYSIIQPKARKLKEIVIPSIANSKPKSTGPVLPPETDPDRMTKADLDLEIKRAELKKKIKEVSLLEIKELKARGEVIPTELVNSLIREMSEAMKIAYMDGIENYTVVIARQKKMSVQEEADVKKHFTELINNILKRQTYVAKRGLKSIVKAYQEIRGKGESK